MLVSVCCCGFCCSCWIRAVFEGEDVSRRCAPMSLKYEFSSVSNEEGGGPFSLFPDDAVAGRESS